MKTPQRVRLGLAIGLGAAMAAGAAHGIDNSSIGRPEFQEHKATYGLVYKLPKDVTDVPGARINGPLREKLLVLGLKAEADTFNTPHVVKDGKEVRSHNRHNTLVYSMTKFDPPLQASMKQVGDEFNKILPEGINTPFMEASIVEIGFAGNVLREIYRINFPDGSVTDVAAGRQCRA